MSTHHISTSIRGALNMSAKDFAKAYEGVFSYDDGKVMSIQQARAELIKELEKGHMIVPAAGCDNFDWITGCRGHEDPKPGTLVMTNFVTGEAVPAGRVQNSQAGEPSAAYVAGFEAGMDGDLKAAPFELSKVEADDWLIGYEDGEMD